MRTVLMGIRASEAEVIFPNLGEPSSYHHIYSRRNYESRALRAASAPALPNIFLGTMSEDYPEWSSSAVAVPAIALEKPRITDKRTRRRRRTASLQNRPAAAYWKPELDLGGKSQGYAYGYG